MFESAESNVVTVTSQLVAKLEPCRNLAPAIRIFK
jgi:hypothetical protein